MNCPARSWIACGVGLLIGVCAVAVLTGQQTASPQDLPRSQSVLRIAVDLVQLDAVVTDERGRHVPDLSADDFIVLQDGKPQTISTFVYVPTSRGPAAAADAGTLPAPTPSVTPDGVRRTIAIVVDDLSLSFESINRVRETLRRVIDESVEAGDLVAIVRTGAGMGALQQFTTDRRALHAAAERVRWNMTTRITPFEQAAPDSHTEALQNELFTAGTLGAVRYVLRGVSELPGRKSVIVFSDGFRVIDGDGRYGHILDLLRSVADAANRAGVVLYTIDARGLASAGPSASDKNRSAGEGRRQDLRDTQEGLGVLAADTGGLFIRDRNDLFAGVRRVLDDQQGYYLLGYVPDSSTFAGAKPVFHPVAVQVKRRGLHVRSRSGFLGRPEQRGTRTIANRMVAAVTSPFAGGDLRLRLSSFFGQVETMGPVVQSFMHVDARDLTFAKQADGTFSAQLETLAMTFGENGQVADQSSRRYTVTLSPERHARALKSGFVYNLRVPVKQPGPYQLRIALRDVASDRIGSASHFIDVPDVKKGRLTLSGLLIQGSTTRPTAPGSSTDRIDDGDPNATVAVRRFRQLTETNYVCYVYNARRGPSGQPQLEAEIRLYRDGVEVFRGVPRPVVPSGHDRQIMAAGVLQLGPAIPPGRYLLEIAVVDRLAKKAARATQSIDFDVIE